MTNMKKMTMIPLLAGFILGSTLSSGGFANTAAAATTSTAIPASITTASGKSEKPQTNHLPNIKILATGGTIAGSSAVNTDTTGYKAGSLGVETLIKAVPEMKSIANVSGEQIANIDSTNMNNDILLKLAKRTNELLARDDVDGIVITHGTDTLEETAYFLDLVVKSDKPVVVVGSMRPATAISADGPYNLYNAVKVAGASSSKGQGVLVLLNDRIGSPRYVSKTNTTTVDTFKSVEQGYLGAVVGDQVYYYNKAARKHTTASVFDISNLTQLPQVDILYEYQNNGRYLYDAAKGIVVAGSGNGNLSTASLEGAEAAGKKGGIIARSTRVGSGVVSPSTKDAASNFVSADSLNPQKARILLMLALTKTHDVNQIQSFFNEY
jgi:L-asparaginase